MGLYISACKRYWFSPSPISLTRLTDFLYKKYKRLGFSPNYYFNLLPINLDETNGVRFGALPNIYPRVSINSSNRFSLEIYYHLEIRNL